MLIELQKSQKRHHRIIHKQMKKRKYLEKHIYLQKKDWNIKTSKNNMDFQTIINLLGDITNQPSKFRTRNWIEINDKSRGIYNANNDVKF